MQLFSRRGWVLPLSVLAVSALAQASSITVSPTVTFSGGLYTYNYSITNTSGDDLEVLDITVDTGDTTIKNTITAPAGFKFAYDSVLGLASFLENSSMFGATPISGFSFESLIAPGPTTFNGTLLDANFNVVLIGGSTSGPLAAPAPEPSYLLLLVFGVPLFLFRHGRSNLSTTKLQTVTQKED